MLPASFAKDGFVSPEKLRAGKLRHLLIGTDGWSNTGKTEFACSAPGPIMLIILDRGVDPLLDNPRPPPTRSDAIGVKIIKVPLPTSAKQDIFVEYWRDFRDTFKRATENADVRTIVIDGDSDSWELQRLAAFGKLTQVPPILYTEVNAARRALIARAWDCGKIVIATNKLKDEYAVVKDANGNIPDANKREKTGNDERQGFSDQNYLWQLQLRHLYDKGKWGVRILKCKSDSTLEGVELWGEDCNFTSLVQTIYPNVPLTEWGYR